MFTTAEVAERIGVSKNTLLRWISEGRLRDTDRDWRNWRVWSDSDVHRAETVRDQIHGPQPVLVKAAAAKQSSTKVAAMPAIADDMHKLAAGRQKRAEATGSKGLKSQVMPLIARDMDRLGQGREHRAK